MGFAPHVTQLPLPTPLTLALTLTLTYHSYLSLPPHSLITPILTLTHHPSPSPITLTHHPPSSQPMHDDFDLYQEQQNKKSLLSSSGFLSRLLSVLRSHIDLGTGALVVSALLDFFTFALCPPYW